MVVGMEQIWPIMTAVLGANMLMVMFLAGLYRCWRWRHDETKIELYAFGALLIPLFYLIGGFYLFG